MKSIGLALAMLLCGAACSSQAPTGTGLRSTSSGVGPTTLPTPIPDSGSTIWNAHFWGYASTAALMSTYIHMSGESGVFLECHRWLWNWPAVRIDWAKQTNLTAINETGCSEDDHLIERGFSATKEIYVQYHVRYQAHFQFDWSVARAAGTAGECTGATKKLFLIYPSLWGAITACL